MRNLWISAGGYPQGIHSLPMTTLRDTISAARRIVVKLGTSSLVNASGELDPAKIDRIVDAICLLYTSDAADEEDSVRRRG